MSCIPRAAEKIAEQAVIKDHGMDTAGLKTEQQQQQPVNDLTREIVRQS